MQGPIIWFDKFVNFAVGWWDKVWSSYGGKKNETISLTLGAEEAEVLWKLYKQIGDKVYELDDIQIDDEHKLGEFSSDLCDVVQPYHALRCISHNWRSKTGKEVLLKCPGADLIVDKFLDSKGIKD